MGKTDVFDTGDNIIVDMFDSDVAHETFSFTLSHREARSLAKKLERVLRGEVTTRPRFPPAH